METVAQRVDRLEQVMIRTRCEYFRDEANEDKK